MGDRSDITAGRKPAHPIQDATASDEARRRAALQRASEIADHAIDDEDPGMVYRAGVWIGVAIVLVAGVAALGVAVLAAVEIWRAALG